MVVSQELPKDVGLEGVKLTGEKAPKPSKVGNEKKIGDLDPYRGVESPYRIDLLNMTGEKIGQAEYGLVTEPTMLQKFRINLDNRAKETAHTANKELQDTEVDPKAVTKEIQEELTEQHLESVLHLVFLKFGGDVYSASKITLSGHRSEKKAIESQPDKGKLERNFIIPRSGAEKMKGLLTGTIPVSLGEGVRFDVDPYYSDLLEQEGFTCVLEAKTPSGKEIKINVNFYYGREEGATGQNEEKEPESIEPDLALAA